MTRPAAVIVFLALALMPLVLLGRPGPTLGGSDRALKNLAEFPPNLASNTFRRIGRWFNDRMGLRLSLSQIGREWHSAAWDTRISTVAVYGRDSWLFWSDDEGRAPLRMSDMRGRLRMPASDIERFDAYMSAARTHLAACGKPAFVFIAPNKQSIHPEMLEPSSGTYGRSRLDDVLAKVNGPTRAMLIDPRAALRDAKSRLGVALYSPTDTHWNALGAFIAYRTIVDTLARSNAIDRPAFTSLDDYEIVPIEALSGDIATALYLAPRRELSLRLDSKTPERQPLATLNVATQVLRNPKGKGRLLLQGDSFSPSLASLLALHFAEVHILQTREWPRTFDGKLVADINPDVVIVEVVERHLPLLVTPPTNLDQSCSAR